MIDENIPKDREIAQERVRKIINSLKDIKFESSLFVKAT
jgi:hypothetical protein